MKPKKNALEWTVFALSLIAIGAVVTLLFIGGGDTAAVRPDLVVQTGSAVRGPNGHAIPVTVRNIGNATAEQARIEIALLSGSEAMEKAELTIAFVPRRSKREGWVVFERDPRCCTISARAVSFEKP